MNDFSEIQNKISFVVAKDLENKKDKTSMINELLFSLFKIYYLNEEKK